MGMLELISLIIVLSAALAYFNIRFLKLPSTIGLMILALGLSLFILVLGAISPLGGFMQIWYFK